MRLRKKSNVSIRCPSTCAAFAQCIAVMLTLVFGVCNVKAEAEEEFQSVYVWKPGRTDNKVLVPFWISRSHNHVSNIGVPATHCLLHTCFEVFRNIVVGWRSESHLALFVVHCTQLNAAPDIPIRREGCFGNHQFSPREAAIPFCDHPAGSLFV